MVERAELRCLQCEFRQECGPAAMVEWLRRARMVRRDQGPEPDLIGELFRAAAEKLACPECGEVGLAVRPLDDGADDDWGDARRCEACGGRIARERLEALPEARLCTTCQAKDDRGEGPAVDEYCPRCGDRMVVRQSRGAGITRYVSACPRCGR